MRVVRDDPARPDPDFGELYAQLPDATDLWPWLDWAKRAAPPVLYLGIGAGRLAVPLHAAGIRLVGVDSHPGMLAQLRRRLPDAELIRSRIEELGLDRRFELVMVPSNILYTRARLERAAAHLAGNGRLAFELANPHWLRAGAGRGVRILRMGERFARLEIDYQVPVGETYTQQVRFALVWPEQLEAWVLRSGLALQQLLGWPDRDLPDSPTFYGLAGKVSRGAVLDA